jgi:hypothetical protein
LTQPSPAFYELDVLGECPHPTPRLACDFPVSRWYVLCPACFAAGPTAETPELAAAAWAELVEFVDDIRALCGPPAGELAVQDGPRGVTQPARDSGPPGRGLSPSPRPVLAREAAP